MNSNENEKINGNAFGLQASMLEFSKKCRRISIKNIAAGVLNQDILELLKPFYYQQIHIDKNSQSCKAVLLDGDSAQRCIDELNNYLFRGQRLSVSLASCDFMLCVTQLPLTYSYDQFVSLITPFGTPERCFLVHSEYTGQSLGYGCVEFTSKESSIKAKNQLNGFQVHDNTLQVHWLDSIPTSYSGLYSRCLLVEDLPADLKDHRVLIQIFSMQLGNSLIHPSFCQLANPERSGCNFAIVEYEQSYQAEQAWAKLNRYQIGNQCINVSFCVPGPCGLVVLNALRASRDLKRDNPLGGLLPTPLPLMEQNSSFATAVSAAPSYLPPRKDYPFEIMPSSIDHEILKLQQSRDSQQRAALNGGLPLSCVENMSGWNQTSLNQQSIPNCPNSDGQQQRHPSDILGAPQQYKGLENIPVQYVSQYRSRSESVSSGESGIKHDSDDNVFEPLVRRRSSREDLALFDTDGSPSSQEDLSQTGKLCGDRKSSTNGGDVQLQFTRASIQSSQQQNGVSSNPLVFLREESQRSESTDSAYGGSQGSNSSGEYTEIRSNGNTKTSQHQMTNGCQVTSNMQNGHHATSNGYHAMNGYSMVHNGDTVATSNHGIFTGSSGEILHHHQANGMMNGNHHAAKMSDKNGFGLHCGGPTSAFSAFNGGCNVTMPQPRSVRNGMVQSSCISIPKPEFTKADDYTKIPLELCNEVNGLDRKSVV